MLFIGLAAALLAVSGTVASPLIGALSPKSGHGNLKRHSSHHLSLRTVNEGQFGQLPTCRLDDLYEVFPEPAVASPFCSVYIASSILVQTTVTPTYAPSIVPTGTGLGSGVGSGGETTPTSEPCPSDAPGAFPTLGGSDNTTVAGLALAKKHLPPALSGPTGWDSAPAPPGQAGSYPGLRLSSACSCLVTPSTVSVTLTRTASPVFSSMTALAEETLDATGGGDAVGGSTSDVAGFLPPSPTPAFPVPIQNDTSAPSEINPTNPSLGGADVTATSDVLSIETAVPTPSVANDTIDMGSTGPTGVGNMTQEAPHCSQTFVRGNGTFRAQYTVRCGYSYSNLDPVRIETQPSYLACVDSCDRDPRCFLFSFELSSGERNCYVYNDFPLPTGEPDEAFDSGSYVVGSNNATAT